MSTPDPAATRKAILDAASRLFAEQGAEVRLEDVAAEAQVSRQSVYLHFGSRTGLLIGMVEHMDTAGALPPLIDGVFNAATPVEALEAVVHLHAEYHPTIHPVARVFMAGRYQDDALRATWDERMESRRRLYHAVVEQLSESGSLDDAWDIESATDLLWTLTSLEVWERLVIDRGWSKHQYSDHLRFVIQRTLVATR